MDLSSSIFAVSVVTAEHCNISSSGRYLGNEGSLTSVLATGGGGGMDRDWEGVTLKLG